MSASIRSKDFPLGGPYGYLRERTRSGLPEANIIAQIGRSLREIRGTPRVPKAEMIGVVPESWRGCSLGTKEEAASNPLRVDMLTAHDAITTDSRETHQKLGKLANWSRHAAHTSYWTSCQTRDAHQNRKIR